jgi:hypothetical protein
MGIPFIAITPFVGIAIDRYLFGKIPWHILILCNIRFPDYKTHNEKAAVAFHFGDKWGRHWHACS